MTKKTIEDIEPQAYIDVYATPQQQADRLISLGKGVYKDKVSGKTLYKFDEMPTAEVVGFKKARSISENLQRAYAKGIPSGTMSADMETLNAISGGATNWTSPTQLLGATGKLINNGDFGQFGRNLILGNDGIVSDNFAQKHPYWSIGANLATDGVILGIPSIIKNGIKGIRPNTLKTKSSKKFSTIDQSLNWNAEDLFKAGNNTSYTLEDLNTLKSYIPEYKEIERTSKLNGTFLKMSDGSIYKGDPREWVIAQSKNVRKNYSSELYHHGDDNIYLTNVGKDVTGEVIGEKPLWTSTNPNIPSTYGNRRYTFVIPKNTTTTAIIDAHNNNWRSIAKNTTTNDFVNTHLIDDGIVRINNVVDVGPLNNIHKQFPIVPGETIMDYFSRVFAGDDVVLGKNVLRKSLLGNNGNFNPNTKNIFKVATPAYLTYKETQKRKN